MFGLEGGNGTNEDQSALDVCALGCQIFCTTKIILPALPIPVMYGNAGTGDSNTTNATRYQEMKRLLWSMVMMRVEGVEDDANQQMLWVE